MAVKFGQNICLIITSLEGDAEMFQKVLVSNFTTTEVELKLYLMASIIQDLFFDELDGRFVVQLSICNVCQNIQPPQVQKISSASAEYPPLSLVILGSHILQNSFDACAAAAADTSAAIVAASLELLAKGAMGLTLNVLSLGMALAI